MAWAETQARKKPRVFVLIPHWGEVTMEWAMTTLAPLFKVPMPDFDKVVRVARGIMNLDTERNMLVNYALEDPLTTHMFFVDTDTIFETPNDPNEALRALLVLDAPIASGLYRAKQSAGFIYAMWKKHPTQEGYMPINGWTLGSNWLSVDAIGMGCCLIKREVFEKIQPPWYVWDKPSPSEDFAFCEKLKAHGYDIRVFTDVKCSHIGLLKVHSDGSVTVLSA